MDSIVSGTTSIGARGGERGTPGARPGHPRACYRADVEARSPTPAPAPPCPSLPWLRASVATVWLATGLLVVHPAYRTEGAAWLARLGLPPWLMVGACAAEVALALRLYAGPWTPFLSWVQVAAVAFFTLVLATLEPLLLAHPYGVLSKNLPLLAIVAVVSFVEREGWSARATWTLRAGMAVVWLTEGIFPKVLFQQPMELAVVAGSGLVPGDPGAFLRALGLAQAASGVAALLLPARVAAILLGGQALALVILPLLVSAQDPLLWVHPFGPMTKNLPILVGTVVAAWRLSRR